MTFVETGRTPLKLIGQNASELGVDQRVKILSADVRHLMKELAGEPPFDIVLADPPYEEGWELKLLNDLPWAELLALGGVFCMEWGSIKSQVVESGGLPEKVPFLAKVREKNYGDSVLTTFERTPE